MCAPLSITEKQCGHSTLFSAFFHSFSIITKTEQYEKCLSVNTVITTKCESQPSISILYTALQMKNSMRVASAITLLTAEIMDNFCDGSICIETNMCYGVSTPAVEGHKRRQW